MWSIDEADDAAKEKPRCNGDNAMYVQDAILQKQQSSQGFDQP